MRGPARRWHDRETGPSRPARWRFQPSSAAARSRAARQEAASGQRPNHGHAGRKKSMSDRPSGASDYNITIIEEFRANQGRVDAEFLEGAPVILIHHIG